MTSSALRKRLSVWWNWLYLYPRSEPLPKRRSFWIATALVALAALAFSVYFILYLTTRHAALLTNAEDLGIMDQAVWSTLHGQLLHQTICNSLGDTNCYNANGITRFAIHFDPLLFLISPFYLFWPDPRTLQVIQTLVVASGAFPAFWLARLRLRNEWVAAGFALLYLLYPAQQYAVINDFHAVTLTSALLLFTLYCMYTRRTVLLFVFAILAMACKEQIPLVIALYGLWSMVFQRRWRSGLGLVVLACVWVGVEYFIMHLYGGPLLASRYAQLGHGPVEIAKNILLHPVGILKQYVFEHDHLYYLRTLFAPGGYLMLLAPWVLVLLLPSLVLNLFSSKRDAYSGLYHYDAEMVPALIFATIEALVLIVWVCQRLLARRRSARAVETPGTGEPAPAPPRPKGVRSLPYWTQLGLLVVLMCYLLISAVRADITHGALPFTQGFAWPQTNAHTELATKFFEMIPPDASVSAQSGLVPHISQRSSIYLFPYADDQAKYILLDLSADVYPMYNANYTAEVKKVLLNGAYGIQAAENGFLLLKRGLPGPGISPRSSVPSGPGALPNLPASVCTFENVTPQAVENPVQATFTGSNGTPLLDLLGYHANVPKTASGGLYLQVSTYWRAQAATLPDLKFALLVQDQVGKEHLLTTDDYGYSLCPTNTWVAGQIVRLNSFTFVIKDLPVGIAHLSVAVLPADRSADDLQARLGAQVNQGGIAVTPGTNAVQLATFTYVG